MAPGGRARRVGGDIIPAERTGPTMKRLARDVMSRDVIAVPTTMDLRELGKLFLEKGIHGAPVIDGGGQLAGVISQTDLVYYNLTRGDELVLDSHFYHSARVEGGRVPSGFQFEDCNSGSVADVMTPVVHSVSESATIESVVQLMLRHHIHRVIVRRGRAVTGIISALDVLRSELGDDGAGRGQPAPRRARPRKAQRATPKRRAPKRRVTQRRPARKSR